MQTERMYIRVDPTFQDRLAYLSRRMHTTKSEVVRRLVFEATPELEKPIEEIIAAK